MYETLTDLSTDTVYFTHRWLQYTSTYETDIISESNRRRWEEDNIDEDTPELELLHTMSFHSRHPPTPQATVDQEFTEALEEAGPWPDGPPDVLIVDGIWYASEDSDLMGFEILYDEDDHSNLENEYAHEHISESWFYSIGPAWTDGAVYEQVFIALPTGLDQRWAEAIDTNEKLDLLEELTELTDASTMAGMLGEPTHDECTLRDAIYESCHVGATDWPTVDNTGWPTFHYWGKGRGQKSADAVARYLVGLLRPDQLADFAIRIIAEYGVTDAS